MFAVFLDDLSLSPDDVVAVFAAAGFRTALDARAAATRAAGGVLVDDADEAAAGRLRDALAHRGFGASVVPAKELNLPVPQRTKELVVKDDSVDVADSLGRLVPLPLSHIVLLAAVRTRVVSDGQAKPANKPSSSLGSLGSVATSMVLPGAQTAMKAARALGGNNAMPSTALVEREEIFVEVVTSSSGTTAEKRLRLDQSGVVFRAGTGPRSLVELCKLLQEKAPLTTTRQRGFAAIALGIDPPPLKSLREFDREISRCLWRRLRP